MIWLTWRQHRAEAVGAVIVLALVGAFLLFTGLTTRSVFDSRVHACLSLSGDAFQQHGCQGILRNFEQEATFNDLVAYLNFLPALIGLFVGAPLVAREIERGTHRLVWTQGVTRLRWISTKLTLLAAGSIAVSVMFTAMMTWWRFPIDQVQGRFLPVGFDFEGLAPIAYGLFAFTLGVAVGSVMRRTVAAMAVTLLGFLAVRFPVEFLLRPHYLAPLTSTADLSASTADPRTGGRGDWILTGGLVDHSGHRLDKWADVTALLGCRRRGVRQPQRRRRCLHPGARLPKLSRLPARRSLLDLSGH